MRFFISRIGQMPVMCSDNGTNFDDADKVLKICLENLTQSTIQHYLSSEHVA